MFKKFNFKSLLISLIGMLLMLFVLPVGAFAAEGDVEINDTNFPDPIFQSYVRSLPGGFDGILTPEDIEGITEISITTRNISDLKGIEFFTALSNLNCGFNPSLTSLNVGNNSSLTTLSCNNCINLTSLTLPTTSNLTTLECNNTALTVLDLSNYSLLETLNCSNAKLSDLDLSNNPNLITIECNNNNLTVLNLKNQTKLETLNCTYNQLTSLDISKLTNLKYLFTSNNKLNSIDVTNNPNLASLSCSYNPLNLLNVSKNAKLLYLYCDNCNFSSLDVRANRELNELQCQDNNLNDLDLSQNTNLMYFDCSRNNLTNLDVTNCPKLYSFKSRSNKLTSIDISNNPDLYSFYCEYNPITYLDTSNNPAIEYLFCSDTPLIALDVSKNTALKVLAVGNHVRDMEDGTPLSSLQGFDKTKVSDLNGGNFDNDCINFTGNTITYSYDTGKADSPLKVTLNKLEHVHQTTLVNGQAPTATQDGWKDYYSCICGKNFEDAAATVEIVELEIWKANDGKLPATGEPSGGEEPEIIEGQNSEWTADSNEALSFRSSADFSEFLHVLVDGIIVDPANYTLREGSIIVTFKPEYLKTLSVGKHSISIVATSGTASTNFMITETPSGSGSGSTTDQTTVTVPANGTMSPATGLQNHSGNTVLIVLFVLVCLGLAGTMVYRVKKNR